MINQAVKAYQELYERILPTGSRVICSTPPNDTDEDYIVLVTQDKLQPLVQRLQSDGWITDMSYSNNDGVLELNSEHEFYENGEIKTEKLFQSWKRYEKPETPTPDDFGFTEQPAGTGTLFNILVTCNQQYFEDFTRATFLAKALDLKDKSDRVILFQALCQDIWPTERKKKSLGIGYDITYHPMPPIPFPEDMVINIPNTQPTTASDVLIADQEILQVNPNLTAVQAVEQVTGINHPGWNPDTTPTIWNMLTHQPPQVIQQIISDAQQLIDSSIWTGNDEASSTL